MQAPPPPSGVPDETTVCKFRHWLEEHAIGGEILQTVNPCQQGRGVKITTGTNGAAILGPLHFVDAILVAVREGVRHFGIAPPRSFPFTQLHGSLCDVRDREILQACHCRCPRIRIRAWKRACVLHNSLCKLLDEFVGRRVDGPLHVESA